MGSVAGEKGMRVNCGTVALLFLGGGFHKYLLFSEKLLKTFVKLNMGEKQTTLNCGTAALLFLGGGFLVLALGVGAYIHLEVIGACQDFFIDVCCCDINILQSPPTNVTD